MDPKERRKLMKGVGEVLDRAETTIPQDGKAPVHKIAGEGWQAYVYEPANGKRTLHVEIALTEAA